MATYVDQTLEREASQEDIQDALQQKAHELFMQCDKEGKGVITKRDMQNLQGELSLTPDQLEAVFDSLDNDCNNYLTLQEFTNGFGRFVGVTEPDVQEDGQMQHLAGLEQVYEHDQVDSMDDEKVFDTLLATVGGTNLFDDVDVIKSIWMRLRREEPELLGSFEEFLARVTGDIKRSQSDLKSMEAVLQNRSSIHDEELRKLYEEMEQQMKQEKERITAQEEARERRLKEQMEAEIREKDQQLQELLSVQSQMESKMHNLSSTELELKQNYDRLLKEKEDLESMLHESQEHLDDSRSSLSHLRRQQQEEKMYRAKASLGVNEGIARERESLVKQLEMLRTMNRKLRDDKDEAELQRAAVRIYRDESCDLAREDNGHHRKKELVKQGSVMSKYFGGDIHNDESTLSDRWSPIVESDGRRTNVHKVTKRVDSKRPVTREESIVRGRKSGRHVELLKLGLVENEVEDYSCDEDYLEQAQNGGFHSSTRMSEEDFDLPSPRGQPVGANDSAESQIELGLANATPERLFKVVFVGDSGVGKSSFMHQFCKREFRATFAATIGVDFQVKSLVVDGHLIALQLWDTAGQERFRSITKQYFRKADGIMVFYDVTSEISYKNVRNWITSIQEGIEDGTVLMLLGNKVDLLGDSEDGRVVTTKDGAKLADEYDMLFCETSAKSGRGVQESVRAMASLLREKEDIRVQKAIHIDDNLDNPAAKKKGCCPL
ncbi:hypothetical protein NP493_90g01018 [Ridgeia piscesae]|uniref:EF-hand domain-containing protein n=1 Tax=Ridgeia piscesae TaxID=27915 RepID=A0AAD9UHT2_RIDPI|nr:hypothetical protein NP493_90g01018 [Ridgeia piscesae]